MFSPNSPELPDGDAPDELLEATGSFVHALEGTDTTELPTREFFYKELARHSPHGTDGEQFDGELRAMYGITEITSPESGQPVFLLPHLIPDNELISQTGIAFGLGDNPKRPYSTNLIGLTIAIFLIQPSTNQFMREARKKLKETGESPNIGQFITEQKHLAARLTDRTDTLELVRLYNVMKELKAKNGENHESVLRMSMEIRSNLMSNPGRLDPDGNESRLLNPY